MFFICDFMGKYEPISKPVNMVKYASFKTNDFCFEDRVEEQLKNIEVSSYPSLDGKMGMFLVLNGKKKKIE